MVRCLTAVILLELSMVLLACGGRVDDAPVVGGQPDALTQDARNLYWTTLEGAVVTAPKEGGRAVVLTEARPAGIERGVWVDGSDVYFLGVNDATNRMGLLRAPITGGPAAPVVDALTVAVDASGIYWMESDPAQHRTYDSQLRRRTKTGEVSTLATQVGQALRVALDDEYVYWTDRDAIRRVRKTGGDVADVFTSGFQEEVVQIIVDRSRVYFATCLAAHCDTDSIRSTAKDGTGSTIRYAENQPGHGYAVIAVDDARVYWLSTALPGTDTLHAAPLEGGPTEVITEGSAGSVCDVRVDADRIYWTRRSGVLRKRK